MKSIWGKAIPKTYNYSENSIEKFKKSIDLARDSFKKQFSSEIDHRNELELGRRFKSDDDILWVLESNVKEEDFILNTESILNNILLGAAETDYYYTYEKQW